jgi:Zn-dependent protease with chaperone function
MPREIAMHSLLIWASLVAALFLRLLSGWALQTWQAAPVLNRTWLRRWQFALVAFCLPPLLILAMAIAVVTMGIHGSMLGHAVGGFGYGTALVALVGFGGLLSVQVASAWRTQSRLRGLPQIQLQGQAARDLEADLPFAAMVGFWRPVLVVSRGIHRLLSDSELAAVLCHEQAHLTYRDNFWFFWLGWLRDTTAWLPGTPRLWQELLLLREMRADRWAAQRADPLVLAESLLKLVRAAVPAEAGWVMFSEGNESSRLEQRINALLAPEPPAPPKGSAVVWVLGSLAIAALPLLTHLWHRAG